MRLCLGRLTAVGACALLCAVYVGVLYIGYDAATRSRDEPAIIRRRFACVLGVCALSPLLLVLFSAPASTPLDGCARETDVLLSAWLGLAADSACCLGALGALCLTSLLFLGPIVMMGAHEWRSLRVGRLSPTLVNARTLVVVTTALPARALRPACGDSRSPRRDGALRPPWPQGPIAEEIVFRAAMCPLLFGAGFTPASSVLISALVFGAAHLHHRVDMRRSWLETGVIFAYTSLFGAYSAYLFMRTGRLLPPLLAHALCNLMGLPEFGRIRRHAQRRLVAACFALGLLGFGAATAADAVWRPPLFGSVLWDEHGFQSEDDLR